MHQLQKQVDSRMWKEFTKWTRAEDRTRIKCDAVACMRLSRQ